MKTIVIFLLIFSLIVVFHEFGHYYMAKKAGILVREFALGMGPKLFSQQGQDGTTYTLRMLPLGGYVRLAGLNDEDDLQPGMQVGLTLDSENLVKTINLQENLSPEEIPVRIDYSDLASEMVLEAIPLGQETAKSFPVSKKAFMIEQDGTRIPVAPIESRYESATVWDKIKTNFAGPFNNFILSIVIFTFIGFLIGYKQTDQWNIAKIVEDSPAAQAGLQAGDIIIEVDQVPVDNWDQLVAMTEKSPGQTLNLKVDRQGQVIDSQMTLATVKDEATGQEVGQMGIYQGFVMEKMTLLDKLTYGFIQTYTVIAMVFTAILSWFTKGFSLNDLGGPVAMAQTTHEVVSYGFVPILAYMAMLSANLGFMNLLPIPALDGGKILLNLIEAVRGKPLSQEKEGIITLIGVGLLLILMVLVTWNDIMRLFS